MGGLITFSVLPKRTNFIGPLEQFPGNVLHFAVPNRSVSSGKPYEIILRCYWECLREQIGNLGNFMGTWWEPVGNTLRTRTKITLSTPPQNEKTGLIMGVCWAFLLLPSENRPGFQEKQTPALQFSYHQFS